MFWKLSIYYTGLHDHTDKATFQVSKCRSLLQKSVKQTKTQTLKTKTKTKNQKNKKNKNKKEEQTKEIQKQNKANLLKTTKNKKNPKEHMYNNASKQLLKTNTGGGGDKQTVWLRIY